MNGKNWKVWKRAALSAVLSVSLLATAVPAAAQEMKVQADSAAETEEGLQTDGAETEEGLQADGAETEEGLQTDGAETEEGLLPNGKSVYNILLIGSDHRNKSWNGNSDVMMVATINEKTGKLFLTSFMRDLYADIPGYGVHKLNYAYAAGGAGVLEETLKDNYDLDIDNYAVVDFETMASIVDLAGGVQMEISDAECKVLNMYLESMGVPEDYLPGGGTYVLNGNQAVAYMRIRFVGNNDYQRTQRQRDVLSTIFASMKELDAAAIGKLAEQVLPLVEHDVDMLRMVKLMALLPQLTEYELEESRIPYDDLYHSENGMLVPDFEATVGRLHETLYGEAAD